MNTNFKKIGLIILFTSITITCSKREDETPTVKDCEKNNYGVLTINYTSKTERHSAIFTQGGNLIKEKISPIGTLKDTVRLKPGTYIVNLASINSAGQATSQNQQSTITTSKCSEKTIDANL